MPKVSFQSDDAAGSAGRASFPRLTIEIPRGSPPPYANISPKANDASTLLVHTPYSPGYYDDDDFDYGYFPRRKQNVFVRALHFLKWPVIISSIVTICVLTTLVSLHAVKVKSPVLYARQSMNLNISSISIMDASASGLHAHVVGEISFDSSKVEDRTTRIIGRIATTIMRKAEVDETALFISRVEDNGKSSVFGRASVPRIVVDIRDKRVTPIDFISTIRDRASVTDIAKLVEEYFRGELAGALFRGDADLPLRSGILPLGTHHVAHDVRLSGASLGKIPFELSEFKFSQNPEVSGIHVLVVASTRNPYPINIDLPGLDWLIEAPACVEREHVQLATAHSDPMVVLPHEKIDIRVNSQVGSLPAKLMEPCANSDSGASAMDRYFRQYLSGESIRIFVRGKTSDSVPTNLPSWFLDLLQAVSIPIAVPGRNLENGGGTDSMVKRYGLSRVKITLPPRSSLPGGGGETAYPHISAIVNAVIELPKELDFTIGVDKLRGISDMYYLGDKFGVLAIQEWTTAQSWYTSEGYIEVVAEITDLPIEITDQDVFKKIVQKMFFAGEVNVDMDGTIDVGVDTPVGGFSIRNIPAQGTVALRGLASVTEEIDSLKVISTMKLFEESCF
ncbi:uncharacterized protein V1518DRAFT_417239 [Limtongia smithiae]|uniref:uncharacterized protein n=1 Tax=Limtongia smithiae TaxID=1125753 RepID=UPI0034D00D4A